MPATPLNHRRPLIAAKPPDGLIPMQAEDFTPLPSKSLTHRGIKFTRSSIIRAEKAGKIQTMLFRMPGSTKGRRYILTASLDTFLQGCLVDIPMSREAA